MCIKVRMPGGSTAFYLLPFVVTEVQRIKSNTGMGFRHGGGSPRAKDRRYAIRNKEVQIPRRWHRRCCRAPQNHRLDQLGSRSALVTPWARLVSDWGHQGLCLRVLGAHFGHIFAHILHAGWRQMSEEEVASTSVGGMRMYGVDSLV